MIDNLTLVAKLLAFGGVAAFVIPFVRVGWWRTAMGRHVMAFMVMIFMLVGLAVVAEVWPDYPGKAYVRLGCWIWIAAMLWWRAALRWTAQHDGNGNRSPH